MAGKTLDRFCNIYKNYVQADTATVAFTEWPTGYKLKDGYAFLLHQIDYQFNITGMNAASLLASKSLVMGLGTNNQITLAQMIANTDDSIIDRYLLLHTEGQVGTLANVRYGHFCEARSKDFTNLPGGGLLFAPSKLYLFVGNDTLGVTIQGFFKLFWTMLKIDSATYQELYESMNPSA